MKRRLVAAVCAAVAVATAAPALALESSLTGFLRFKGIVEDTRLTAESNKRPDTLVDQRLRAKYTGKVNDYLSFVYFAEVDFQWGDGRGDISSNQGGGFGGDAVNLETKNLYMVAKLPNTPLTATLGLQGFADQLEGLLSPGYDMAGVRLDWANLANLGNLTLGWFKLHEGETVVNGLDFAGRGGGGQVNNEDDVNLWAAQFAMKPMGNLKLGVDAYYLQNQDPPRAFAGSLFANAQDAREDLFYLGANASYKLGMATLSGVALYNFGTIHQGNDVTPANGLGQEDVDVSAFVLSAKAAVSGKNWGAGLRGMYWSPDDDATDSDMTFLRNPLTQGINNGVTQGLVEAGPFGAEGLNLMMSDASALTSHIVGGSTTHGGAGLAMGDAAMRGYGLLGVIVNGAYTPPAMPDLYVRGAAGYFRALENDRNVRNATIPAAGAVAAIPGGTVPDVARGATAVENLKDHDGKTIGTEIAVRVGYKVAKNLDVSVTAAQAWLGDFYNKTATDTTSAGLFNPNGKDPDNPYIAYWMATLSF